MSKKKREQHTELRPPPKPKRPWTRKDKAWMLLVALIVIVPMAWAVSVTEERLPMKHDLMDALRGQMLDLDQKYPDVLAWSIEERDGVLELGLTVSSGATEEQIEYWRVYFLATAEGTVGIRTDYEYELTVRREE